MRYPRIIALANRKGGCGKTTVAVNLAAALSRRGSRVLVVDADPQGHAGLALGMHPDPERPTLREVLLGEVPPWEAVMEVRPGLSLMPAKVTLAGIEQELSGAGGRDERLRRALSLLPGYEAFVLDTPPSLGLLSMNCLCAADLALVPVDLGILAEFGLEDLHEAIQLLRRRKGCNLAIRVLASKVDSRTRHDRETLARLASSLGEMMLSTQIRRSVRVAEAAEAGIPVSEHPDGEAVADDFNRLAEELAPFIESGAPIAGEPAGAVSKPGWAAFRLWAPEARSVYVAGTFNDWTSGPDAALVRNASGFWEKRLRMAPGRYEYKYIVDGQWRTDPSNPDVCASSLGENSVMTVGAATGGAERAQTAQRYGSGKEEEG